MGFEQVLKGMLRRQPVSYYLGRSKGSLRHCIFAEGNLLHSALLSLSATAGTIFTNLTQFLLVDFNMLFFTLA